MGETSECHFHLEPRTQPLKYFSWICARAGRLEVPYKKASASVKFKVFEVG